MIVRPFAQRRRYFVVRRPFHVTSKYSYHLSSYLYTFFYRLKPKYFTLLKQFNWYSGGGRKMKTKYIIPGWIMSENDRSIKTSKLIFYFSLLINQRRHVAADEHRRKQIDEFTAV